jgi:hypothetical protein
LRQYHFESRVAGTSPPPTLRFQREPAARVSVQSKLICGLDSR